MTVALTPSYVAVLRYLRELGTEKISGVISTRPERGLYVEVNGGTSVWTTQRVLKGYGSTRHLAYIKLPPKSVYAEWEGLPIVGGPDGDGPTRDHEEWFLGKMATLTRQAHEHARVGMQ